MFNFVFSVTWSGPVHAGSVRGLTLLPTEGPRGHQTADYIGSAQTDQTGHQQYW